MIEPFVVCNGCQTKTIKIDWKGTITQQPWIHAGKYDDYSRESQEDQLDKWVDEKVCNKLAKDTCKDPPRSRKSGRLLEGVSTTTTTTREVLAVTCRRLEESTSLTAATTVAGASTPAGVTTTGANATQSGNNVSSHADAMSVPALMAAVIVASFVLV